MSHYSKANIQTNGYDTSVSLIKKAIGKLKYAKSDLSQIYGVQDCEDLKKEIDTKIANLEKKISTIKSDKSSILSRAKYLDQKEAEERRRREAERLAKLKAENS